MRKEEIMEILNDWNFWKNELDSGIIREQYIHKCLKYMNIDIITALIGIRRAGKSYIMRQLIKHLIQTGVEKQNILMINFEDKRFLDINLKLLDEIFEAYIENLQPNKKPFVFIDEVHLVPKWEKWVRTMHELKKANIIISGSSSKLLRGELATVLTGRHLDIFVYPLSFKEFLSFKNLNIKDKLDIISKRIDIKRFFNEYIEFGGFPEVVLIPEKKNLLLTYIDDIITKDIEKRYKLKKNDILRSLARFYLTNISNMITYNSIRKFLYSTTNTIEKFSSYLEETNLIFFLKRFSFKIKEQENAPRKIYCTDIGLANALGFRFSSNIGRIAENIVAMELNKKKTFDINTEIYYWRNLQQEEIDFIVKKGQKIQQLIQVCWDISEYKTKEREIKALIKGSKQLKCNNLLIITDNFESEEIIAKKRIIYTPLWKWLLQST